MADLGDNPPWVSDNSASESACSADHLRWAVEEAQRQQDMFAKLPRHVYMNLSRSKPGMLSQLMNPDPRVFPPGHPYRGSLSSQGRRELGRQSHSIFSPLQASKSSVALPQVVVVVAQAPRTDRALAANAKTKDFMHAKKALPHSIELEEELDSEDESMDNGIQISQSLAQRKLVALADLSLQRHLDHGPVPYKPPVRPQTSSAATVPIPLAYPYNLPAPALPMTPRATRRQMLSTELSESLRRNLLWERRISRNHTVRQRDVSSSLHGLRNYTVMHDMARSHGSGSKFKSRNEGMGERTQSAALKCSWAGDYHYAGW